ncbi:MAG: phosphatidate cytidylyltransferase [Georgfuchsia sp.]
MLKQRVVTALVLLAVLIPVLFFLPAVFAIVTFALITMLAAWEWSRLLLASIAGRVIFPLSILACCGLSLLYPPLQLWMCALAAGFWLLVPLWLAWRWPLPHGLMGYLVGAVVLLPAWISMTRLHEWGPWQLLAALALVWVADIAAYFVGRAMGRHKLAPAISPGKTWEGAAGAVIGGLAYVFFLQRYASLYISANMAVLALGTTLLVAVSIIGDLFESMIKRQAGVKDSSQLLPGHGGILDRIDSLTSMLPVLVVASSFWPQT